MSKPVSTIGVRKSDEFRRDAGSYGGDCTDLGR
jgi:hypothetical protein